MLMYFFFLLFSTIQRMFPEWYDPESSKHHQKNNTMTSLSCKMKWESSPETDNIRFESLSNRTTSMNRFQSPVCGSRNIPTPCQSENAHWSFTEPNNRSPGTISLPSSPTTRDICNPESRTSHTDHLKTHCSISEESIDSEIFYENKESRNWSSLLTSTPRYSYRVLESNREDNAVFCLSRAPNCNDNIMHCRGTRIQTLADKTRTAKLESRMSESLNRQNNPLYDSRASTKERIHGSTNNKPPNQRQRRTAVVSNKGPSENLLKSLDNVAGSDQVFHERKSSFRRSTTQPILRRSSWKTYSYSSERRNSAAEASQRRKSSAEVSRRRRNSAIEKVLSEVQDASQMTNYQRFFTRRRRSQMHSTETLDANTSEIKLSQPGRVSIIMRILKGQVGLNINLEPVLRH